MAKDNNTLGVSQRPKGYTWLELRDLARVTLDAGVSALMLGHPGVGKSALAKTLASEMKIPLIESAIARCSN
jgi:MoxR-like ATPase